MTAVHRLRRDAWYWAEQRAGRLWSYLSRDRVSYWLDWLPAFCAKRRYIAERALNPHQYVRR